MKKAYGDSLLSVVLYGSAAEGDHHERFSDTNILAVLRDLTPRELTASEPIFRWWREQGNPAPLLMTEEEMRNSADCFAIEFHDLKEQGRLLHGTDLVSGIVIQDRDYRAQVEHELRSKLLRLRQKAAGVMEDRPLLLRLMADSVSTFCVLFRHALALSGLPRRGRKREILEDAALAFQITTQPFLTLLDLREGKLPARAVEAVPLLERYLSEIQKVAAAVDLLGRTPAVEDAAGSAARTEGDMA
jgi:predicted nucleotidyltransferase